MIGIEVLEVYMRETKANSIGNGQFIGKKVNFIEVSIKCTQISMDKVENRGSGPRKWRFFNPI